MILCSACLHALPEELVRCPFCSEELDLDREEEINEQMEWSIVRTVSTELEARLIAGRLQSDGIPAFVLSQVDSTRNLTVGALAVAKVFVPEQLLSEADEILRTPPPMDESMNDDMQ